MPDIRYNPDDFEDNGIVFRVAESKGGLIVKPEMLKHGAFSWFELMTTDTEGAKKFYMQLFGWDAKEMPMGESAYTVFNVNGEDAAGMMAIPGEAAGMPPSWCVYVTVDDVDATAARVEELGGKVDRPPADIPEVGRFCVIRDPQGAYIFAISYAAGD
jgi:predicted enzyme related to lactoylglutathione lyase